MKAVLSIEILNLLVSEVKKYFAKICETPIYLNEMRGSQGRGQDARSSFVLFMQYTG